MSFVIFDLEFNQPYYKQKNAKLTFEILEVGAVKFDENFNVIDTFRVYVKNKVYKDISPTVKRLTKITKDDLKYGLEFDKVYSIFAKWVDNDVVFHWGADDSRVWKSNCTYYGLNKNSISFSNLQQVIMIMMNLKHMPSLKKIGKKFNVEFRGSHNGLDDSYNTLKVLESISESEFLNEYIQTWYRYQEHISNEMKTLTEYDKRKFTTYCKKCKKSMAREIMYCDKTGMHIFCTCTPCNIKSRFSYNLDNDKIKKKMTICKNKEYKTSKQIVRCNYIDMAYYKDYARGFIYKANIGVNKVPKTLIDVLRCADIIKL